MLKLIKIATFALIFVFNQTVQAEMIDRLAAKVNGQIITLSEVMERANLFKNQVSGMDTGESPSEKEFQKRALDSILEEKLLLHEGKNLKLKVDDEKVKQAIEDIKKQNNINDKMLKKMLERDGFTIEEYKNKIRDQILIMQVRRYQMRGRVNVTEKKLHKYYRTHLNEFMQSSKIHVRHILFLLDETLSEEQKSRKRKKALGIHQQIKGGADFIAFAKLYSEDESAAVGGDLGVLERGKMIKEFEDAAFKLQPGEVSSLVETPYGLHIIQIEKIIPSKTKPFREVKNQIEQMVFIQDGQKQYREWIRKLKKKAVFENKLFKLEGPTSRLGQTASLGKKTTSKKRIEPSKQKKLYRLFENKPKAQPVSEFQKNKILPKNQWDMNGMEKRLRYLKILQKRQIISDQEYARRKQELLKQF